jgi:hypothetical protein
MEGRLANVDKVLAAIQEVAGVVHASRSKAWLEQTRACEDVAQVVRRLGGAVAERLRGELSSLPLHDPLRMTWNPMRMLDRQDDEPAWTRWLANLFRLPMAGAITWSCFCKTVAASIENQTVENEEWLATPSDWMAAAEVAMQPHCISTERASGDGGFMDITVECGKLIVVVENKLWGGWHDRPGIAQGVSYEGWARRAASGSQRVGLVYLSAYEADEDVQRRNWAFITWAKLAQAFRRSLRGRFQETLMQEALAPLCHTIAGVEQDLLGFRLDVLVQDFFKGASWRRLDVLARITNHLEESDGEQ